MAKKPIFIVSNIPPFYREVQVEFEYYKGFALQQKQRSIVSLHEAFYKQYPQKRILEISTKSETDLGIKLSAFNLTLETKKKTKYSVEVAFQGSKVFEFGGPYKDMLAMNSHDAKKDARLINSGQLRCFYFSNRKFPLNPTTYFYNWLYINALHLNHSLAKQIVNYDAFTDIVFNQKKSINCQARAAAIYVGLYKSGLLFKALEDKDSFLDVIYKSLGDGDNEALDQVSLWNRN